MNRRAFLKSAAASAAVLSAPIVLRAAETNKPATEGDVLDQARERIGRHRQGDCRVVVRDAKGKPVNGARVRVTQLSHDFLFGSNAFKVGRIKDPELEAAYRKQFAGLLNYATLGFYWSMYEPEKGHPQYAYTDQVVEWCASQGIACKGHPLAWDYVPDPRWLPEDAEGIRQASEGRVREIVSRFKGRIDRWDVVNEPTDMGRTKTRLGRWANSLGAGRYIADHLKVAREANPGATLLVNDYRTDEAFYKILEGLRVDGKLPFDAVGIQSHMHDGVWPMARVWETCERFAKLGLPIHFTETTIVSGPNKGNEKWGESSAEGEAAQAECVPKFYTALFSHPAVEALTWWDFSDDGAWMGAPAGWLRKDMTPKPVYERLQALIKGEWWTRAQGSVDANGEFACRAFYGRHQVVVEPPNGKGAAVTREVRWSKGGANRLEVVV
jgi:GH35 family endo-1,4-beta-xylanase